MQCDSSQDRFSVHQYSWICADNNFAATTFIHQRSMIIFYAKVKIALE